MLLGQGDLWCGGSRRRKGEASWVLWLSLAATGSFPTGLHCTLSCLPLAAIDMSVSVSEATTQQPLTSSPPSFDLLHRISLISAVRVLDDDDGIS